MQGEETVPYFSFCGATGLPQWHLKVSHEGSKIPPGLDINNPSPLVFPQHFSENLDHFSDNMEDFSNDLFSSFFDDPVLAEKNPLLDMDLDPPTPGIQAEHSYSLSGDSAPQSPLMPVKTEDNANGDPVQGEKPGVSVPSTGVPLHPVPQWGNSAHLSRALLACNGM
uniref:Uncharacterized protein n=1 Tax=Anas platyrhynchos platyrhynchos TaxID=8840 RepID=A0A493TBJ7_ANAPP